MGIFLVDCRNTDGEVPASETLVYQQGLKVCLLAGSVHSEE